jgi:hypothetical protein
MVSQVCCSGCVEVAPHSTGAVLVLETNHRKEGRQSSSTHVPGDCGGRGTRLPCPTVARHKQPGSVPVHGRLLPDDAAAGRAVTRDQVVASSSGEVNDKVGERGRQAAATRARESPL